MTNPEIGLSQYNKETTQVANSDIPEGILMTGWKEIPIKESSQPLVLLNDIHERIKVQPMYYLQGIQNATQEVCLRLQAAEKLIQAAESLPDNYSLIVFDAYRPISVQTEIFNAQQKKFAAMYPELSTSDITRMTEVYVSLPSTDPKKPSPHSTGGAIDLSILDENGNILDMGTEWDSFDTKSKTTFFRETHASFHNNRKILHKAMSNAGFTNYPEEWWHFDFGNQFWAHILKNEAIYGLIEGGDIYVRER